MAILTKLSKKDFEEILLEFNIGEYKKHEHIPWSLKNTLYIVQTNKGKYVIKIFENSNSESIEFQLKIMEVAFNNNVPVPITMRNREGEAVLKKNEKFLIVQKYIKGYRPKRFSPKLVAEIAKKQAIMTKAMLQIPLENIYNWGGDYHFAMMSFKDKNFEQFDSEKEERQILNALTALSKHRLRRSPVHGDFDSINLLVQKGKLKAVLDWDDAHEDYAIYDVVCFIAHNFVTPRSINKKHLRKYLMEFQKIMEIYPDELKAMYYFVKQRLIGSISWHINQLEKHSDIRSGIIQVIQRTISQYTTFSALSLEEFLKLAKKREHAGKKNYSGQVQELSERIIVTE